MVVPAITLLYIINFISVGNVHDNVGPDGIGTTTNGKKWTQGLDERVCFFRGDIFNISFFNIFKYECDYSLNCTTRGPIANQSYL